jgi:radical SAM superfamily enzyme YgiQ (UPF0313 family)
MNKKDYKVVLVHPPLARLYPQESETSVRQKLEPLSLEMIAAHNPHNLPMDIYDMDVHPGWDAFTRYLEREQPNVIAITINTPLVLEAKQITQKAREVLDDPFVVVGGNHPTHEPAHTAEYVKPDLIWRGDAENFLKELIDSRLAEERQEGRAIFNSSMLGGLGNPEEKYSMDNLNFPLRANAKDYSHVSLQASRGCLWKCIYCGSADKTVVWRTAESVLKELDQLHEKGILNKQVYFLDDCFLDNPKRIRELSQGIEERPYRPRSWVETRTDTINRTNIGLMKRIGVEQVTFGIEAGNQRVSDSLGKRINLSKVPETLRLVREYGIKVRANFMIGHLDETEEEVWDTIHLAEKLQAENIATTIAFYKVLPLPGTPLYREARKRGIVIDRGFEDFLWYGNTVSQISKVAPERLDELHKTAYEVVGEAANTNRKTVDY